MSLKKAIVFLLIAAMLSLNFTGCSKDDPDNPDDEGGDDFSGSISGGGDKDDDDGIEDPSEGDPGDPDMTYYINNAEELKQIKRYGKYILNADIDLTGVDWKPVGTYAAPFSGTLDGNGHSIIGLKVTACEEDSGISLSFKYSYCGMFGVTENAEIKNIDFINADINVSSNAVNRTVYAGILAGYLKNSKITDCSVSGSVTAESVNHIASGGGIAGLSDGSTFTECISAASVTTKNSQVRAISGGILGMSRLSSSIVNSSSSGKISSATTIGVAYSGGIVGYCSTTNLELCFSVSEVLSEVTSASPQTGSRGGAYSGGIVATTSSANEDTPSSFIRCYSNNVSVKAIGGESSAYAGGLGADLGNAKFTDCYSRSPIISSTISEVVYSGGLFAMISQSSVIKGCFFTGSITVDVPDLSDAVIGTLAASFPDDEEELEKVIITCAYRTNTVYTINGKNYSHTDDVIKTVGTARASNIFTTLSLLCEVLGWDQSQWKMENGIPKPII